MKILAMWGVAFICFLSVPSYSQTGILADFSSNSTSGWAGTNPANFQLTGVSQELRIISSSTGFENLEFTFSPINILANPVVSVRVRAASNFTMRVDLKDAAGHFTNDVPVTQNITGNGVFQTYTFNFSGRFNQSVPSASTVDPTQIVQASFFFNAGTGYSGTLYFDDVTIGDPIPFLPGKILVNQVGYELQGPKIAIYQSDLMSISTDSFYVLNNSDQIVHRGLGVYQGAVNGWTNRYYWTLDFSDFNVAGIYKVKLKAGNLTSYTFEVAQNILFNSTASKIISFFNGMRHTGAGDNSLSFNGPRNDFVNVSGGWWDATGDPGKHMSHLSYANYFNPQQIPFVVWSLLKSYSLNPPAYASFSAQLMAEARWGADYLHRNADPLGYLYIAVFDDWGNAPGTREITEWGQAPDCDYCRSPNYQAAMREGAGMAIAALARAYNMNLTGGTFTIAQYLAKAELLYNHLKSPGAGYATKNLEYCNDHTENIIDFYCGLLAAIELYKATANPVYLADAQNYADLLLARQQGAGWLASNTAGTRPFFHAADEGMPVIALIEYAQTDPSKDAQISSFISAWINWYQSISTEVTNPFTYVREYGSPYASGSMQAARKAFFLPHANETGYWWQGENARIASMTAAFIAAYRFNGTFNLSTDFNSRIALSQLDWILGKNPFDVCMMTGVGTTTYPTYLNGSKKPNIIGGVCNGITAMDANENDIEWAPYDQEGGDAWRNWRWIEQWLPHDAWFLLAVAQLNNVIDNPSLPVNFVDFKVRGSGAKNEGWFSTSEEKDLSHFIVEKSINGQEFYTLSIIQPRGSELLNQYYFTDENVSASRLYYRVISVDISGEKKYSSVEVVVAEDKMFLECYPVPFDKDLTVAVSYPGKEDEIRIYNSMGALVWKRENSEESLLKIPTESWPAGMYFIEWRSSEGSFVKKLLK